MIEQPKIRESNTPTIQKGIAGNVIKTKTTKIEAETVTKTLPLLSKREILILLPSVNVFFRSEIISLPLISKIGSEFFGVMVLGNFLTERIMTENNCFRR